MALTPTLAAQQGTVDSEALLGRILWYTVPSATRLDPQAVRKDLTDLGFTRKIPNVPSESDVFRRTTLASQRNKIARDGYDDQFENWMVRDVTAKRDGAIAKKVVVEVVDPNGRRLDYEQIVDVEFIPADPKTGLQGRIQVDWINGFNQFTHPHAQEVVDDILSGFQQWRGQFHDAVMRNWIRGTLQSMGATAVRPTGGIYFLEEKYTGQLEKLEKFITDHFPPGGECHSVEIPDTSKQREMVRKAIEAETLGAVEAMMAEISDIRKKGTITTKQYDKRVAEVRALEQKLGNYTKLLETDMMAVTTRIELLAGMTKGLSTLQGKKADG